MTADVKLMTADDLLAMPEDGRRHELMDGELITMSPPGADHGAVAMAIGAELSNHAKAHHLGRVYAAETGFAIGQNPDSVRAPDAAFVRTERVVRTGKYFPGAPDLAVEVLSPNDRASEVEAKVRDWLRAGCRMVIVIDPETRTAVVNTPSTVTRLAAGDTLDGGEVLPGWRLALAGLFE